MKMIINADDFGYSAGINYGIFEAYKNGVLTSATLMTGMPGAEHAAEMMRIIPGMGVGLHLNTALGKPGNSKRKTLTDENGFFIKPDKVLELNMEYNDEELYDELKEQFERFAALTGQMPTHMDSHLFSSDKLEKVKKIALVLANEYKIPLRNHETEYYKKVRFINHRDFGGIPGLEYVAENFDEIIKNEYVEIMSHPGYVDTYVMKNSSYNIMRAEELDFLTGDRIKNLINENKVELVNYGSIANDIKK